MTANQYEASLEPGSRLKAIRERLRLTQRELSERSDVSESEISRIENGEGIGRKRATKLALHLGVSWSELMDEAKP